MKTCYRFKTILFAILWALILFGCDSGDHIADKGKSSVVGTMRSNPGTASSVDSMYSDASTAVHLDPNYTYSYQSGTSITTSTTANPATATATDGQDIHIYPSGNPQSEVHISVSLANPDNLLVSANTIIIGNSFQGYYYSNDSGTGRAVTECPITPLQGETLPPLLMPLEMVTWVRWDPMHKQALRRVTLFKKQPMAA